MSVHFCYNRRRDREEKVGDDNDIEENDLDGDSNLSSTYQSLVGRRRRLVMSRINTVTSSTLLLFSIMYGMVSVCA